MIPSLQDSSVRLEYQYEPMLLYSMLTDCENDLTSTWNMEEDAYQDPACFTSFLSEEEPKVPFNILLQEGEHELVPTHLSKLLNQLTELSQERFMEAFLESGPQAILQLYITIICKTDLSSLAILSVVTSLSSLALAISDYTDHKFRKHPLKGDLTMLGNVIVFLWKLPTVASRCISLAIFASGKEYYGHIIMFPFFILHMVIGALWEFYNLDQSIVFGGWIKKGKKCHRKFWRFLRMMMRLFQRGWIFNFTILEYPTNHYDPRQKVWVEVDERKPLRSDEPQRSMWLLLFFNILLSLENIFLVLFWFNSCMQMQDAHTFNFVMLATPWERFLLLGGTAISFQLGLIFMALFYVLKRSSWVTKTSNHSKDQFLRLTQRHVELNHEEAIQGIFNRCTPDDLQMLLLLHDMDGNSLFGTACSQEMVNVKIIQTILNHGGFPDESPSQDAHLTQWLYLERIFFAIYCGENQDLTFLLRQFGSKLQLQEVSEFPPLKFAAEMKNNEAVEIISQFLTIRFGQYLDFRKFMHLEGDFAENNEDDDYFNVEIKEERVGSVEQKEDEKPLPPIPSVKKSASHEHNVDEEEEEEEEAIYDDVAGIGESSKPEDIADGAIGRSIPARGFVNKGFQVQEDERYIKELRGSKRQAMNSRTANIGPRLYLNSAGGHTMGSTSLSRTTSMEKSSKNVKAEAKLPKQVSISPEDFPKYFAIAHSDFDGNADNLLTIRARDRLMVLEDEDVFWTWVKCLGNNQTG